MIVFKGNGQARYEQSSGSTEIWGAGAGALLLYSKEYGFHNEPRFKKVLVLDCVLKEYDFFIQP